LRRVAQSKDCGSVLGCKQYQPGIRWQLHEGINNPHGWRLSNWSATLIAVNESAPRIEQAEVIIDFGERTDSASGIGSATALVNSNGRLQAGDAIYIGSVELPEKLPGMKRERLDVLPLSFSEDGIESERTFPAAARTGNDDELIPRDFQRQIFEVVRPRPFNADVHGF